MPNSFNINTATGASVATTSTTALGGILLYFL